jgi:DNA repair exonuclease SbcCD ATPase subunit
MQPHIGQIKLQGFRSFGKTLQIFDPSPTISVLWGGNSQGKTSFAESVEFLLTGQIARRELLASMKDEFAEALRNAHIGDGPVVVEAQIRCSDGNLRRLTRTLVEDYRRGSAAGCVSRLEIDGEVYTEEKIETILGLRLSHAPLRAPVLGQHTLGYVFSASPTERAAYFRAILDTQDLEDFRIAVAALQPLLAAPVLPELTDLAAAGEIPAITATAGNLRRANTEVELEKHLLTSCSALLVSIGISPMASLADRVEQIDKELERRRAQTFPMALFARAPFARWSGPLITLKKNIDTFLAERAKIDAETRRLVHRRKQKHHKLGCDIIFVWSRRFVSS